MKKVIVLVVIVAVAAGGAFLFWRNKNGHAATEETQLQTAAAKRGPLRQSVQCTGRVVSNLDVEIKCKASGLVLHLPFDVSDDVKKDDLLLEIDPVDQLRGVQQAEAGIAATKAKLAQAKANLAVAEATLVGERRRTQASQQSAGARVKDATAKAKREQELLARKQSTVEQAETAQTTAIQAEQEVQTAEAQADAIKALELQLEVRRQDINLAQAQVDADNIALSLANQRLTETKVAAPMDGTVSVRNVQIGQIIASGINNVGGGTSVLTISDLSHLFVLASVDESDIGNVVLEQKVRITADAYRGKRFFGKVVRIATKGVNLSNVVTFEVRVEVLSDNKSLLKPEMTANVEIVVAEKEDALVIPARAVYRKDGETFVNLKKPDGTTQEQVPVETGITSGTDIEIVKGIEENVVVVFKNTQEESRWRNSGGMRPPPGMMLGAPPRGGR